jgi:uncharacterized protein YbbC (DUF1343 family)
LGIIKILALRLIYLSLLLSEKCSPSIVQNNHLKGRISPQRAIDTLQKIPLNQPIVGAAATEKYLHLLKGKRVALVVNQTSVIDTTHLADFLVSQKIEVVKIFAPEHGFRGTADAGEIIKSGIDARTGIMVVSLYGNNKKPTSAQLADVDVLIFDIQDVGVRFYTYISTMHYVMEACAENNKSLLVLDRPNPNGHYIAGAVLDTKYKSFVGMHPIPVVHGLTVGELAQMINGEKWLTGGMKCNLTVIPCQNYTHQTPYQLPIKPSPNLPNSNAIAWYATLCLFEGTNISVGRGTDFPFEVAGAPDYENTFDFVFTPMPKEGAKDPLYNGKKCYGIDFSVLDQQKSLFTLEYVINFYQKSTKKETFFKPFFNKLIGNDTTVKMIKEGKNATEIAQTWQEDLTKYRLMRQKYLLYPDN